VAADTLIFSDRVPLARGPGGMHRTRLQKKTQQKNREKTEKEIANPALDVVSKSLEQSSPELSHWYHWGRLAKKGVFVRQLVNSAKQPQCEGLHQDGSKQAQDEINNEPRDVHASEKRGTITILHAIHFIGW